MSIDFRCIHLAQPPLDQGETQQIEKIISIYANEDVDVMESTRTAGSIDSKVYTLEDDIEPPTGTKSMPNQMVSVWREVPGSRKIKYFAQKKVRN